MPIYSSEGCADAMVAAGYAAEEANHAANSTFQQDRAEIERLQGEVDRLLAERVDKAVAWDRNATKNDEIERLRAVIKRYHNFVAFCVLWTGRDNVTDAERVSVIANHPICRGFCGTDEQIAMEKKDA